MSSPKTVTAGALQGSVLGPFLFNVGIEDLEDNYTPPVGVTPEKIETAPVDTIATSSPTPMRRKQEIEVLPQVRNVPTSLRRQPAWLQPEV